MSFKFNTQISFKARGSATFYLFVGKPLVYNVDLIISVWYTDPITVQLT